MAKSSAAWDQNLKPFREHVIALGEVLYAYNRFHDRYFDVLLAALILDRPDSFNINAAAYSYALALWNLYPNDRMQRDLAFVTLAELPTSLAIQKGIEGLKWAKTSAAKLSDYRNLIAHTPIRNDRLIVNGIALSILVPQMGGAATKPANTIKLANIKNLRFWKALRNDLLNLSDYVELVVHQILARDCDAKNGRPAGARRAWPHRPILRSIRQIAQTAVPPTSASSSRSRTAQHPPSRKRP
jgi:hypothetical protein